MDLETLYSSCFMSNSNWFVQESTYSTEWSREDNKRFESALAIYDKDTPDRWLNVAAMIPGKTVFDVIKQYRELEEDVSEIEAGHVPVPGYLSSSFTFEVVENQNFDGLRRKPATTVRGPDHERKKGVPWTEDEHKRFLMGLLKYGKGDWRNIARNFVITKTPTQVASHAQKYYIRQKVSGGKDKRRPSIHDITTVNLTETSTTSEKNKPLSFNVSPSNYNNGSLMVFNPNFELMPSPSDINSKTLKLQGQDLYDCSLHEAYAKLKIPSFRTATTNFNKEAVFGIHAL